MAIDLNALREKYNKMSQPNQQSGNSDFLKKFVQLVEGTNTIRILPWKDEDKVIQRITTVGRFMVKLVPCAIFITVCGRLGAKRMKIWLARSSPALGTT